MKTLEEIDSIGTQRDLLLTSFPITVSFVATTTLTSVQHLLTLATRSGDIWHTTRGMATEMEVEGILYDSASAPRTFASLSLFGVVALCSNASLCFIEMSLDFTLHRDCCFLSTNSLSTLSWKFDGVSEHATVHRLLGDLRRDWDSFHD